MIFSKLKISTKLIISSAVFLIPIGVMLYFVSSMTIGIIQKSMDEQAGINAINPIIKVVEALPEYLDVYLGLQQGNLRTLEDQISTSIRNLDRELQVYADRDNFPDIFSEWQAFRNIPASDEEIFRHFEDFSHTLINLMNMIGELSGLNLVSDMNQYYLVASIFQGVPEANLRIINIGNLMRRNLSDASGVVERWNGELADSHALGRRLNTNPFQLDPRSITISMIPSADLQQIRNSRFLFESDRERIIGSLSSVLDGGNSAEFDDLARTIYQYDEAMNTLASQFGRITGFNITITVAEFYSIFSDLNMHLSRLWSESLSHLDLQIQQNTARAQRQLVLYLSLVFISLILAVAFVIIITRDINRSVKSLQTLFKGLNENDLTLSLPVTSKDEFGDLMTAFNGFLDILRLTFGSFKQSAQLVSDSVFDI